VLIEFVISRFDSPSQLRSSPAVAGLALCSCDCSTLLYYYNTLSTPIYIRAFARLQSRLALHSTALHLSKLSLSPFHVLLRSRRRRLWRWPSRNQSIFVSCLSSCCRVAISMLLRSGMPLRPSLAYTFHRYLFKDHESSWDAGIIALEAGSGFGALTSILTTKPDLFGTFGKAKKPSIAAAKVLNHIQCAYVPNYVASMLISYSSSSTYLVSHAHSEHLIDSR
jgi:hypothetical protein